MSKFIQIRYISTNIGDKNFDVWKEVYDNPYICYLNVDTIERIDNIRNEDVIVRIDSSLSTTIEFKFFIIRTLSNRYYVLKEEEFDKFKQFIDIQENL